MAPTGYKLVFNDEFDGTSLDLTKWYSWRPYTIRNVSNSNVLLSDAEILTHNKFKYCYLEIRAKLAGNPNNTGHNNIFWMLRHVDEPGWQEIDLTETSSGPIDNGNNPYGINKMNSHVHCPDQPTAKGFALNTGVDLSKDYHIYAFEWTPNYVSFFFDGVEVKKITSSEICIPNLYCIVIIAQCKNRVVSECWPSTELADNTNPILSVDYVRVYQFCGFTYSQ